MSGSAFRTTVGNNEHLDALATDGGAKRGLARNQIGFIVA
jgi:hypothetical protein